MLTVLSSGSINLYGKIQNSNLLEILQLLPKSMIGAQYVDIIEALSNFLRNGNEAENYFNTTDFKRFKKNFLS